MGDARPTFRRRLGMMLRKWLKLPPWWGTARANLLGALFDGRALAGDALSYAAIVSAADHHWGHLAKLTHARLLTVVKQVRSLLSWRRAGAQMMEPSWRWPRMPPLYRPARRAKIDAPGANCYDHFAGQLRRGIADSLCARGTSFSAIDGGQYGTASHFLERTRREIPSTQPAPFLAALPRLTERRPSVVDGGRLDCDPMLRSWMGRTRA